MKKMLFLIAVTILFSCKKQTSYTQGEDNQWLLYQQKLHLLLPLQTNYSTAYRIMIAPSANHFPASVVTVWEENKYNYIYVTSIMGNRGDFYSEGTRKLKSEFNLREIMSCYYSSNQLGDVNSLSSVFIESNFNDHYSFNEYSFDKNKDCVISTYDFIKDVFPSFELHVPNHLLE